MKVWLALDVDSYVRWLALDKMCNANHMLVNTYAVWDVVGVGEINGVCYTFAIKGMRGG